MRLPMGPESDFHNWWLLLFMAVVVFGTSEVNFHYSTRVQRSKMTETYQKRAFESLNRCLITLELQRVASMTLTVEITRDIECFEVMKLGLEAHFSMAPACKMIQKQLTNNSPTQINNKQCQMELFLVIQVGTYVRKCFFCRLPFGNSLLPFSSGGRNSILSDRCDSQEEVRLFSSPSSGKETNGKQQSDQFDQSLWHRCIYWWRESRHLYR